MCQRTAAVSGIKAIIQIVKRNALQEGKSRFADFFRSAVIDTKNAAAAPYIDAAFRQGGFVLLNPLMGIPNDENVIFVLFSRNGAEEPERIRTQVLAFIHNHMAIARFRV